MSANKSLEAFYAQKFDQAPTLPPVGAGDFNVFSLSETSGGPPPAAYARYDFFKIMLIRGSEDSLYRKC